MGKEVAGPEFERLVQLLARLPGLGPRSARRAALHLIRKRDELLAPLADALQMARETIVTCQICGNADSRDPCSLCRDDERDRHTLIVVETVADLWALERAGVLSARYHVLGGTLSPLDGVGPKDINLARLIERVAAGAVQEVVLAVSATVDGQATAHYISGQLADLNVKITRLALGVPVGGELDYLDEGTLAAAIKSRTLF
jgi:recombination protein RecR